jgi:adhesin HecA-like repeat protein
MSVCELRFAFKTRANLAITANTVNNQGGQLAAGGNLNITVDTLNNTRNDTQDTTKTQEKTIISQGCFIKGEILGTNDISIFGKIDGAISLKDNILTVEKLSDILNKFIRLSF